MLVQPYKHGCHNVLEVRNERTEHDLSHIPEEREVFAGRRQVRFDDAFVQPLERFTQSGQNLRDDRLHVRLEPIHKHGHGGLNASPRVIHRVTEPADLLVHENEDRAQSNQRNNDHTDRVSGHSTG